MNVRIKGRQDLIDKAYDIALRDLQANYGAIRLSPDTAKTVIVAGQHNFRELWTRDACFAILGANRAGRFDVVKSTLSVIFSKQLENGMLPRRISSVSNMKRTIGILFSRPVIDADRIAQPEYQTARRTTPLDQNALVTIALVDYVINSRDKELASSLFQNAELSIRWLASKQDSNDLLLIQEAYGDWIDLVKRKGKSLYTNVCYYKALVGIGILSSLLGNKENEATYRIVAEEIKKKINALFWNEEKGYYTNTDTIDTFESSGNILAILFGIANAEQAEKIHEKIIRSGLDVGMPLKATDASYAFSEIPIGVRLIGWGAYQSDYAWNWIGNLYLIALQKLGKKEIALDYLQRIAKFVVRDDGFSEVYKNHLPVKSLTYTSERPFSWSAGTFIYAVHKLGLR